MSDKGAPDVEVVPVPLSGLAFRRSWRALARDDRRVVRRALRRGQAVEDLRLAAVAVGRARQQFAAGPSRRSCIALALVALFMTVSFLYDALHGRSYLWFNVVVGVLNAGVWGIAFPRARRNLPRAEAANLAVLNRAAAGSAPR